jgi:hypothetical protein
VKNLNMTESNLLTNEVNIQLNVLCAAMMNGVGGEVDSGDVVAEDDSSLVNRAGELREKLTKPRTLSNCIGHNAIFSLSAGPRDGVLALGRPGDQRRSKVDAVAGGRAPSVRAARPVCI